MDVRRYDADAPAIERGPLAPSATDRIETIGRLVVKPFRLIHTRAINEGGFSQFVNDEITQNHCDERDCDDMQQLASGHGVALNELMERHAGKLFNYLLRCLQNEEDAADSAQETFVRIYQNSVKFKSGQRFSTWLYAIATNLVKDRYRYRTRHPQVSLDAVNDTTGSDFRECLPEQSPPPDERLEAQERAEAVRRAVGALPEELRTPLILSEYEELSHAEIGQVLKCSPKAVETRLYRARKQLRVALSKLTELGFDRAAAQSMPAQKNDGESTNSERQ